MPNLLNQKRALKRRITEILRLTIRRLLEELNKNWDPIIAKNIYKKIKKHGNFYRLCSKAIILVLASKKILLLILIFRIFLTESNNKKIYPKLMVTVPCLKALKKCQIGKIKEKLQLLSQKRKTPNQISRLC